MGFPEFTRTSHFHEFHANQKYWNTIKDPTLPWYRWKAGLEWPERSQNRNHDLNRGMPPWDGYWKPVYGWAKATKDEKALQQLQRGRHQGLQRESGSAPRRGMPGE